MRFHHVNAYEAGSDAVRAMLVEPAFREEVCRTIRSLEYAVEVTETASGTVVEVRQTQLARKIPPMAQKLIGDRVEIVQRELWTGADTGTFEMAIPGKPGQMQGTLALQQDGGGCVQTYAGELKVNVPLVGGKLEALVADLLRKALAAEERVGADWLSR